MVGRDWGHNPIYVHSSQSLPIPLPLFPLSVVSVVSYSARNPLGKGVWGAVSRVGRVGKWAEWEDWEEWEEWEEWGEWGERGKLGEWEEWGGDWHPNPLYVHSAQSLPNLFPLSVFSVVSYSAPNPVGKRRVGRSGNGMKEWGERAEWADREEWGERAEREAREGREEWVEIGTVTLYMSTLPNLFQISPPPFPLSVVSVVSHTTPNPVVKGAWAQREE